LVEPGFPTGRQTRWVLSTNGFILLTPQDAENLSLADYTLELAGRSLEHIRIERRYKEIEHKGQARLSFWVRLIDPHNP
jgi:hypothetical protein